MKAVILAGGLGTRLSEETSVKPKPMVEIGGYPILWHIMKLYAAFGIHEFVVALGYKGEVIKDFFVNYLHRAQNLSVRLRDGQIDVHGAATEDWTVHLLDTGEQTQTGGRLRRAAQFIGREPILATYGDGLAAVDIRALIAFHRQQKRFATVTAVRPPARFGGLEVSAGRVSSFAEKPQTGEGWINGGFFVLEPEALDGILSDDTVFEKEPLEMLAKNRQLSAYCHEGFWQCMDTLRDRRQLEMLWQTGQAPWKLWN
jgi:glucose-1-phosphate cytidylyltransferase